MNFDPTPDQETLRDAVLRIVEPFVEPPTGTGVYHLDGSAIYSKLEEGGFLEAALLPEYGPETAVMLIETIGALPYSVGLSGAALVAPMVLDSVPAGPVALIAGGGKPVRHLQYARTALVETGDAVHLVDLSGIRVAPVETPFSDAYGTIDEGDLARSPVLAESSAALFRQWRQVALAAEIGAAGRAAMRQTVDYVKLRRQFGRPIGSYQAVQHRLAECEVLVHGVEVMARWAAGTHDPGAATLAAVHAQTAAGRIAYDTQQFQGASGLTLENAIHFHIYRLRALQGELGGAAAQSSHAAAALWPRDAARHGTDPAPGAGTT